MIRVVITQATPSKLSWKVCRVLYTYHDQISMNIEHWILNTYLLHTHSKVLVQYQPLRSSDSHSSYRHCTRTASNFHRWARGDHDIMHIWEANEANGLGRPKFEGRGGRVRTKKLELFGDVLMLWGNTVMMAMMHDDGRQGILSLRERAKTIRLSQGILPHRRTT